MLKLILSIVGIVVAFFVAQYIQTWIYCICVNKGWMKSAQQRTDEQYLYDRIGRMTVKRRNPYYIDENGDRPYWRLESCLPEKFKKPYF